MDKDLLPVFLLKMSYIVDKYGLSLDDLSLISMDKFYSEFFPGVLEEFKDDQEQLNRYFIATMRSLARRGKVTEWIRFKCPTCGNLNLVEPEEVGEVKCIYDKCQSSVLLPPKDGDTKTMFSFREEVFLGKES